jgi:hypothetical protein
MRVEVVENIQKWRLGVSWVGVVSGGNSLRCLSQLCVARSV